MDVKNSEMPQSEKREERLLRFSFICSLLFTVTEIAMAVVLHSYSILMDGVFDVADLILLGPFLVLVPLLYKPVTERRPYGYAQVESLFLIIKYGALLAVIIVMIYQNIRQILAGGHAVSFNSVGTYEMIIGLLCVAVFLILRKKSGPQITPTIQAELFLWKQDIAGSLGVSAAFFSEALLRHTPARVILPYIDSVVAIVMALFLIREPIRSLMDGFRNLVLFAPDAETMDHIRSIVDRALEKHPYACSFLDVIQTGRKIWVEVYIAPDKVTDTIDLRSWAAVRSHIEMELRDEFQQVYVELIPDIPDYLQKNLSALEEEKTSSSDNGNDAVHQ